MRENITVDRICWITTGLVEASWKDGRRKRLMVRLDEFPATMGNAAKVRAAVDRQLALTHLDPPMVEMTSRARSAVGS